MVTSALKKDPSTLAKSADLTAKKIREIVANTSAVASSAPDRTTQKQVIALAKVCKKIQNQNSKLHKKQLKVVQGFGLFTSFPPG